jgi:hypothetical protein
MMYEGPDPRTAQIAESNVVAEKRLPYVREELSRLSALAEKLDARSTDLRERLSSVLANRPPLYEDGKTPPSQTPEMDDRPSLAQELGQISDTLERVMLRLEDTQARTEV